MIVDCHTHLHCPQKGIVIDEHRAAYEELDACLVLAGANSDRQRQNQDLEAYVSQNKKAYGFAVMNPVEEALMPKAIKRLTKEQGMCGIVLYCAEDGFHPTHSRAMRLYEVAQEMGLIVYFHNSPPYESDAVMDYAQPWLLDEVARTFPKMKIIIGRMGIPFSQQTEVLLARHKNVYADLSIHPKRVWQVYNLVVNAYEAGVMDKLLFGSAFPFAEPGACIETLLGFNKMLADTHLPQVPREKLRSIVERNALELLELERD